MIDTFTKEQFEAALPRHKVTGTPLWKYAGLSGGEHAYLIPAANPKLKGDPAIETGIMIRSSVSPAGVSAATGEDSIRCWPVVGDDRGGWRPLGSKTQKYITRVPGWDKRLLEALRTLYRLVSRVHSCPKCRSLMHIVRIKKGVNKGKWALACNRECNQFEVLGAA